MKITAPYLQGKLIKRYKRFLADIELPNGEVLTVHTPNTGAMLGCSDPGSRVWVYKSNNPKRKYAYSWELVEDLQGNLIGIHTGRVNALVTEAIQTGVISELADYESIQQEKKFLDSSTRFDLFLQSEANLPDCFVEIKNVTAKEDNVAIFPDAATERGRKHLRVLEEAVQKGYRAVMLFCIQREDINTFSPAHRIDPLYAEALDVANDAGVELLAYKANMGVEEIRIVKSVPIVLG